MTAMRVPISTTCSVLGYPEDDYYASIEHTGKFDLGLTYIEGYYAGTSSAARCSASAAATSWS